MEEQEKIMRPDKADHIIIFGDLLWATYWSKIFDKKKNVWRFEFRPSDLMRFVHNIQDTEYDQYSQNVTKEYPVDLCVDCSIWGTAWFIFCDFKGEQTLIMERLNKDLLIKVSRLRKELQTTKMSELMTQKASFKREAHRDEAEMERFKRIKKYVEMGKEEDK